ncbi:CRISPR-associated helicase Cas3' [Oxalobacteraceae bacterium A2-2]
MPVLNNFPAFLYWGKARPTTSDGAQLHLLPLHALDVAAMGVEYLRANRSVLHLFCETLKCSEDAFLSWAAFFLALHDLGKLSEAFQSQRPDLVAKLKGRPAYEDKQYTERHDSLGFWLWTEELVEDGVLAELGMGDERSMLGIQWWMRAVTGHHGMPPRPVGHVDRFFHKDDKRAAQEMVRAFASMLLTDEARTIPRGPGREFEACSKLLSWWFAGVAVLADWLGSNTDYFPYESGPVDLSSYWNDALQSARRALKHTGVLPVTVDAGQSLQDLFPRVETASPLQHWAATVELPRAAQIYLLEDVTGAGKTEAAVMLAYRLMSQGSASGFFIGLPTMATANAMYRRIADMYQKLFAGDAHLTLAHGFKMLVEDFARSVLRAGEMENDTAQRDETATSMCSAWLADHSKRALLASAGVGTVDQALLAILHSKHQSLRLLGLFDKVLVVDEVHACDAYMQGLLEVLLEFHARTGGPAILLSATLPEKMKQALLDSYARGRNQARAPVLEADAYPLATRWNDGEPMLFETALPSRASVARAVQVHYESDVQAVHQYIIDAVAQGRCVGWIRNTVADAIEAYQQFAAVLDEKDIVLFHARFTLKDRLGKEEQVLARFGAGSDAASRRGGVMIATQVAEQSLDVDFDVLLTDLAPIDRVLQRAGRLQRHVRDADGNRLASNAAQDGRPAPCLWVYGPQWTETPHPKWYADVFRGGQYVYANHAQLWLSAKVLQAGRFRMPEDARPFIEAVFSGTEPVPESLARSMIAADGKEISEASLAQLNALKVVTGYVRGAGGAWSDESRVPTRLGEDTVEVILARHENGAMTLWNQGHWANSMLKVAQRDMAEAEVSANAQPPHEVLRQTLPAEGKYCVLLPLSADGGGMWSGSAWTLADKPGNRTLHRWLYDDKLGFRRE